MSDDKFEVAFSGEIIQGADLEQVKARVGQMFKADGAKLIHLFSGKRVVIKKDIDQQTAEKYKAALNKAGALCEVKNVSSVAVEQAAPQAVEASVTGNIKVTAVEVPEGAPLAPDTDPLHINAEDIDELSLTVALAGSDMQDEIKQMAEPDLDISGLDMAPAGSDISDKKEEKPKAELDITGLKMVD